ncbi:MAG TPA: hypothetical protein VGC14_18865 [Rhizobium sp.]
MIERHRRLGGRQESRQAACRAEPAERHEHGRESRGNGRVVASLGADRGFETFQPNRFGPGWRSLRG